MFAGKAGANPNKAPLHFTAAGGTVAKTLKAPKNKEYWE
jgi:hypothetical protein